MLIKILGLTYVTKPLNLILYILLLLVACAAPQTKTPKVSSVAAEIEERKQREMAAEAWISAEMRLYRIGYPILENGTALCKDKIHPSIGVIAWNSYHFSEEWQDVIKNKYSINDLLQFVYVIPGSPAHVAGLKSKDVPVSINNWNVPIGEDAEKEFYKYLAKVLKDGERISISVQRGQEQISIDVVPRNVCKYGLLLKRDDIKNAYADGERIVVHSGLMDFFKTDEEAALVISHELAHNAMGHIDAKKQNLTMAGLAGLVIDLAAAFAGVNTEGQFTDIAARAGAAAYSAEFEQEADYVGLYFMALAGYEIDNAANFWRRMAIQNPESITMKTSHPTTPERFLAIEHAVDEIKNKKQAGLPLEPSYKENE